MLSYLATQSLSGQVEGLNELQRTAQKTHGRGNYVPPVEAVYWSMRVMAYAGSLVALVAIVGAFLLWKRKLERWRWFLWAGVATIALPFIASIAGWCLTELGRQPWIVQGLLQTSKANSPSVSATWIAITLTGFVLLYLTLLVVDIWLMRRYAGRDLAEGAEPEPPDTAAVAAPAF
jgi:cytochrome d ubiquinol oxidase subunit I